jgi:hypothetical protein
MLRCNGIHYNDSAFWGKYGAAIHNFPKGGGWGVIRTGAADRSDSSDDLIRVVS